MDYKNKFYPETKFGGFTNIDGTIAFYTRAKSLLEQSFVVLDIGCGTGNSIANDSVEWRKNLSIFKGKCKEMIGMDVDKDAAQNPYLDKFHLLVNDTWPLNDNSVDLCICDFVVEHVQEPELFFAECQRVIRSGGYLCIRTANVLSYVGIISKLVPNKWHSQVLSKVQTNRREEDVFPTVYKCNTIGKMKQILSKHGFEHSVYGYEAEPSYLSFSYLFYLLGVIHQRLAFNQIKVAIYAFAKKP